MINRSSIVALIMFSSCLYTADIAAFLFEDVFGPIGMLYRQGLPPVTRSAKESTDFLSYMKNGGEMLVAYASPHASQIACGSVAVAALGGVVLWQVRKNGKNIKAVSKQVADVQKDLTLARGEIARVDTHVTDGFVETHKNIAATQIAIEDRIATLNVDLQELISNRSDEAMVSIKAMITELSDLQNSLTEVRQQQEMQLEALQQQLNALGELFQNSLAQASKTHADALAGLETRTHDYFDDKFDALNAKQDRMIAMLSSLQSSSSGSAASSSCGSAAQRLLAIKSTH